jgi:hypothetical protein
VSIDPPEYLREELDDADVPPPTREDEEELLARIPPAATHVDPYRTVVGTTRVGDLLVLVGNDGSDVVLTTNLPRMRVAGLLDRIADQLRGYNS